MRVRNVYRVYAWMWMWIGSRSCVRSETAEGLLRVRSGLVRRGEVWGERKRKGNVEWNDIDNGSRVKKDFCLWYCRSRCDVPRKQSECGPDLSSKCSLRSTLLRGRQRLGHSPVAFAVCHHALTGFYPPSLGDSTLPLPLILTAPLCLSSTTWIHLTQRTSATVYEVWYPDHLPCGTVSDVSSSRYKLTASDLAPACLPPVVDEASSCVAFCRPRFDPAKMLEIRERYIARKLTIMISS